MRKRGYYASEKILSFIEMPIKGGRRLNGIDILSSYPGLLDMLGMDKFPKANILGDLARRFTQRDINNLADIVKKLSSNDISQKGLKEIVIDIDSSLIPSDGEIVERSYPNIWAKSVKAMRELSDFYKVKISDSLTFHVI
jgi:hypothetical protein